MRVDGARDLRPPSRLCLLGEARVAPELVALLLALPRLRDRAPRGRGEPVLVAPGFATGDGWTARLRGFLGDLGYRVRGWGLGRNTGRVATLLPRLVDRTAGLAEELAQPVRLVGWSLGGSMVREVARERPDLVERVVTLGAPVVGGPKYTAAAASYRRRGYDLDRIEAQVAEREAVPIEVPVAALYSRSDGVVAWRACLDRQSALVEHLEVSSSHVGLVVSPRVLAVVAELLHRPIRPSPPPETA